MENLCMATQDNGIIESPGLVDGKLRLITDKKAGEYGPTDLTKEQAKELADYLLRFAKG